MLFLFMQHPTEAAMVLMHMFLSIRYERVTSTAIQLLFTAILYSKDLTGMNIETDNIRVRGPVTYTNVFLIVDKMQGVPFFLFDSITITIPRLGKAYISDVTFNSKLLTTLIDVVCQVALWPAGMDKDTMLAAAITGYSMADDFIFMGKQPLGLCTEAAWFLFEVKMLPRAFIAYCLELYFIEADKYDDLLTVSDFFALLPRGAECTFDDEYGITNVFAQLDDQTFAHHPEDTLLEHTDWVIAILMNLMQVPELGVLPEIIEIINFPANNLTSPIAVIAEPDESILTPNINMTVAELEALYAVTPIGTPMGNLTPRKLDFF